MSYDYLRSARIRRLHHPLEENPIWKVLGSAITSVFAVAIGLPFLLAFIFLLPACLSVRWLLLFIHWNRRSSRSGQGPESVRGNDSRWLGSAWNNSVIHAVLMFEANDALGVDNFRHLLLTRVVPLYPRLTRRPISLPLSAGIGHCWMQDAKFTIERHVFPGPSLSSEKDLQTYISKLLKEGLPKDKPPWELHILQSFGHGRETVAVLRVHQSVADGTALLRVLCQSLADSQEIEIPHGPTLGSFSFCVNIFRACILGPMSLLVWLFFSGEDENVLTRRSSWTGSLTVTWSASITLPKVIRIKQVTRSTVNCVLLSALAGALRCFLQGCGVKHPSDIRAVLPVDLRNADNSRRVKSRLGNKSSPVFVSLPVAVEGCVPRLWATRKILNSLRNSADPVILYVATTALMSVGPASIARDLIDSLTDKASLQFSSLPGPTSEVYVGGQTLKAIYPLLPAQAKLGISITAITYADQVFVSVIAERALGQAAELILEYLEEQIEMLWNLLLHRRVPGEARNYVYGNFDVTGSSTEGIASRLSFVQQEVHRLSENSDDDDENLYTLRAEVSQLMGELQRRHSTNEIDERRPRRRALSCTTSRKQTNTMFTGKDRLAAEADEELKEVKEEKDVKPTNTQAQFKEMVCLLSENSESFSEGETVLHGKVRMQRKKRNKHEGNAGAREDNFLDYAQIKEGGEEKRGDEKYKKFDKTHETSFEVVTERNKRGKCKLKSNEIRRNCEFEEKSNTNVAEEGVPQVTIITGSKIVPFEEERNTRGNDETRQINYQEPFDQSSKLLGPINTDLRDLYCSNYLKHKLEMLQKEKSRLEEKMVVFASRAYDDEADDPDVPGGVLI